MYAAIGLAALAFLPIQNAHTIDTTMYWMKIRAHDKFERTLVANTGVSIETSREDFVAAIGSFEEKNKIEKNGASGSQLPLTAEMDFPKDDAAFHNYTEMTEKLNSLMSQYPQIAQMSSSRENLWKAVIFGPCVFQGILLMRILCQLPFSWAGTTRANIFQSNCLSIILSIC